MKNKKFILDWLVICIFCWCQIPSALWHEHEFEVCFNPVHHHPEQACLVSELNQGSNPTKKCGHDAHLNVSKDHCTICSFEIAKFLESSEINLQVLSTILYSNLNIIHSDIFFGSAQIVSNKGPPVIFTII